MTEANDDRALRKSLVVAAEDVMQDAFPSSGGAPPAQDWKVEKSQLNQLIGVCGEAVCTEEIENYLRYQASRDRPSWGLKLVERTIEKANGAIGADRDDRARVDAWRLYAVYLARAFTYRKKIAGGNRE
jgi:hypothetical protein